MRNGHCSGYTRTPKRWMGIRFYERACRYTDASPTLSLVEEGEESVAPFEKNTRLYSCLKERLIRQHVNDR